MNIKYIPVIGIGPNKITHGSLVRYFLDSIQITCMIQGVNTGRESTVKTKDASGHNSRHGQEVKRISEVLPDIGIAVLAKTFIIESVDLSDLSAFMISSQNGNAIFVPDFKCDQESDGFQTVISSIDIVAHEEIIGFRTISTNTKELGKIVELTMNITANGDRSSDWLHVRLLLKNFPGLKYVRRVFKKLRR